MAQRKDQAVDYAGGRVTLPAGKLLPHCLPVCALSPRLLTAGLTLLIALLFAGAARANPTIPQGDVNSFPATGNGSGCTGSLWDVMRVINGVQTVLGTNSSTQGWSATFVSNTFTVSCPASTALATGYTIRWNLGGGNGPQASFDVVAGGTASFSLKLTSTGLAEGFRLTTFSYGYTTYQSVGPLGIVVDGGAVTVSDYPGNVRQFQADTDVQPATNATIGHNYTTANACGIAMLDGLLYMAEQAAGKVVQINPNGTYVADVVTGIANATGVCANPFTGHVYVSDARSTVWDVNPGAHTSVAFLTGLPDPDGMALSADGQTLYVAYYNNNDVAGFSTQTQAQVFDYATLNPGNALTGADGVGVGAGPLSGYLYVNTNNGNIWEISLGTGAANLIATGGTRGDFVAPDPNGTLFLTQTSAIARLTPSAAHSFAGTPPSVIHNRDDKTTAYTAFTINSPAISGLASQAAGFDTAGVSGQVVGAAMQRGGQMSWNSGVSFDLQWGLAGSANPSLTTFGQSFTGFQAWPNPYSYTYAWPFASGYLPDIQSSLGGTYSPKLEDGLANTSGSYAVTDAAEYGWPAWGTKNVLSVEVAAGGNPQIAAGRALDLWLTGTATPPASTVWDISLSGQVIASSNNSNGWDVEPDHAYGGVWITVPSSASVAGGYLVRAALPNSSGFFDVTSAGSSTTAPVMLPLTAPLTTIVGGNPVNVTVTLDAPAPTGGATVSLTSSRSVASVPASVTVPAGNTSAIFTVTTTVVSSPTSAVVSAEYNGWRQLELAIMPTGGGTPPAAPTNLTAVGSNLCVTLAWTPPAHASWYTVLRSLVTGGPYNPIAVHVQAPTYQDVNVVNGAKYYYVVTASNLYGTSGYSNEANATPSVTSTSFTLTLNPTTVTGTEVSVGTVTLASPAPAGGTLVTLSSNNTAVAKVPSTVTVPQGATTAGFVVTTFAVSTISSATISATAGGTQTATLTVNPPYVASVSLSPSSVTGGSQSTGTVTLNAPAPSGGASVTVTSSNTSVATIAQSPVTVNAGTTTGQFTVNTTSVQAPTNANIMAAYNTTASTTLTIGPPSNAVYSVNCGGPATGGFIADNYYTGGSAYSTTNIIDTSYFGVAAPAAVYQTGRSDPNSFSYTFPGLTPGAWYTVRLHWADVTSTWVGQRQFSVAINGTTVVSAFDVYAALGRGNRAVVREYQTTADASGSIKIVFTAVTQAAMCSGIEILNSAPTAPDELEAYTTGSGKITLYWDAMPGATGYNLYRGTQSGLEDYAHPVNGGTPVTTPSYSGSPKIWYTDTGLTDGTLYWYTVVALYGSKTSGPSEEANEYPSANGIPWDTRSPSAILSAVTTLFSADLASLGAPAALKIMGPDSSIYDQDYPNAAQPPDGAMRDETYQFNGSDGTSFPVIEEASAPASHMVPTMKGANGPQRRIMSVMGFRAVAGAFYLAPPTINPVATPTIGDTAEVHLGGHIGYTDLNNNGVGNEAEGVLNCNPAKGTWGLYLNVNHHIYNNNPHDPARRRRVAYYQNPNYRFHTYDTVVMQFVDHPQDMRDDKWMKACLIVAYNPITGYGPVVIGCARSITFGTEQLVMMKRVHAIAQYFPGVIPTGSYWLNGIWGAQDYSIDPFAPGQLLRASDEVWVPWTSLRTARAGNPPDQKFPLGTFTNKMELWDAAYLGDTVNSTVTWQGWPGITWGYSFEGYISISIFPE